MSKRTAVETANTSHSDAWWKGDSPSMEKLLSMKSRMSSIPNASVVLKLFDSSPKIKMSCELLSAVDENKRVCLSLSDLEYDKFVALEAALEKSFIAQLKLMNPQYTASSLVTSCKVSEQTEKKYLKTKVQLLGYSRTMGIDGDSGEFIRNIPDALSVPGTKVDVSVSIDGAYLSNERCGLVTKLNMFRVKSVPSEEEKEVKREEKRIKLEKEREELLKSF